MISITITDKSMNDFFRDMNKYSEAVQAKVQKEVSRATYAVEGGAKQNSPVRKSFLRNSIRATIKGKLSGQVAVGAKYGGYVHQGTRPHVILPRNKKMLAWRTAVGMSIKTRRFVYASKAGGVTQSKSKSVYSFAQIVHHPGTKANPFLQKAVDKERPIYMLNLKQALQG